MLGGPVMTIVMFGVLILIMFVMVIRPQQKQQKKRQSMMDGLHVGDTIVTIGRLHGVIDAIDRENETITLDCDGVYLVFDTAAVAKVLSQGQTTTVTTKTVKAEPKETIVEETTTTTEESSSEK